MMDPWIQAIAQSPVYWISTVLSGLLFIYVLKRFTSSSATATDADAAPASPKTALDPDDYRSFPLIEKKEVSHDTRIFRFGTPNKGQRLGLPVGQHMSLKATINGEEVLRAYTPISSDRERGYFDLLIKVYFANTHPNFPEGGKLTQAMERLKIGDTMLVKGPTGKFEYLGCGNYRVCKQKVWTEKKVKHIGMIAGGTGITPMWQVIRHIVENPEDETKVWLLFANQTEADILLRKELEVFAKDPRVHLWYTLDRPEEGWTYSQGFISQEMVEHHLPKPDGGNSIVLMCGPPPMIKFACKPNLATVGFQDEQLFSF